MSGLEDYKKDEDRFFRGLEKTQAKITTDENTSRLVDKAIASGVNPLELLDNYRDIARSRGMHKKEAEQWAVDAMREAANRFSAAGHLPQKDE
jgi:hypothetical protein